MNLFLKSLITSLLKKGLSENLLRKGFIVNFQKKQRLGWWLGQRFSGSSML